MTSKIYFLVLLIIALGFASIVYSKKLKPLKFLAGVAVFTSAEKMLRRILLNLEARGRLILLP